jgi:hypothetical protein
MKINQNKENKKKQFKRFKEKVKSSDQYVSINDKEFEIDKTLNQVLHKENSVLANDLVEWEEDGEGNFIQY